MVSVGNHDMGYAAEPAPGKFWTCNRRDSLIDEYFPPSRFGTHPHCRMGGTFEGSSASSYVFLDVDGLRLLVLTLEFLPRDEVLEWANAVLAAVALVVLGWAVMFWIKADSPRLAIGTLVGANAVACCMLLARRDQR